MITPISPRYLENQAQLVADDLGIFLLEIRHASLPEPVRTASSLKDVTSGGHDWKAWPMIATLPSQGRGNKHASIRIQNIDPKISQAVRPLKGRFELSMQVVSRDDSEDVYYSHGGLFLKSVDADDLSISGEVVGYGDEQNPWPKQTATPQRCPAVWV